MKLVIIKSKFSYTVPKMKKRLLATILLILAASCFSFYVGSLKFNRFDSFINSEL
tara:strand:+ start:162 stop:326 length:165 start_codon:yes stop_codon:yes gene_type:complete